MAFYLHGAHSCTAGKFHKQPVPYREVWRLLFTTDPFVSPSAFRLWLGRGPILLLTLTPRLARKLVNAYMPATDP